MNPLCKLSMSTLQWPSDTIREADRTGSVRHREYISKIPSLRKQPCLLNWCDCSLPSRLRQDGCHWQLMKWSNNMYARSIATDFDSCDRRAFRHKPPWLSPLWPDTTYLVAMQRTLLGGQRTFIRWSAHFNAPQHASCRYEASLCDSSPSGRFICIIRHLQSSTLLYASLRPSVLLCTPLPR